MIRELVFSIVAVATSQSFAFELNEYTEFGCANYRHQVSIDLKQGSMQERFGFKVVPSKVENVQIASDEKSIQFDQVSKDGTVTTYTLQNIYQGHHAAVIYADLYLDGHKVNGCAGYLQ